MNKVTRWLNALLTAASICLMPLSAELPPAQPYDEGVFGVSFGGEFLWWTACTPDFDYGIESAVNLPVALQDSSGKVFFAENEWDSGFRLFATYYWGCDGWDATAVYTQWTNQNKDETTREDDTIRIVHYHPYNNLYSAETVEWKKNLEYRTLDLLLARPYYVSRTLITRPFFGFRTMWLTEDLDLVYSGDDFAETNAIVKWDSSLNVYGMHLGMDWVISLPCGFSLSATYGGTLAVGESRMKHYQFGENDPLEENVVSVHTKESQCVMVPALNLGANLSYENCMSCGVLYASLGYEFINWLNMPQPRRFCDEQNDAVNTPSVRGNIGLHGLTLKGQFLF